MGLEAKNPALVGRSVIKPLFEFVNAEVGLFHALAVVLV